MFEHDCETFRDKRRVGYVSFIAQLRSIVAVWMRRVDRTEGVEMLLVRCIPQHHDIIMRASMQDKT